MNILYLASSGYQLWSCSEVAECNVVIAGLPVLSGDYSDTTTSPPSITITGYSPPRMSVQESSDE